MTYFHNKMQIEYKDLWCYPVQVVKSYTSHEASVCVIFPETTLSGTVVGSAGKKYTNYNNKSLVLLPLHKDMPTVCFDN